MAVSTNGKPVEPGQKGVNGLNGHAVVPKSTTPSKKQKRGSNLISIITRILTWFSIITVLFRCPSTIDLVTDSSPKLCKPYFQLRSFVTPHLEPYYDAYAAPYVETVRPYYDSLDQRVITPATALGRKYGAPRVAQAQEYGQAQWEKTIQPEVLKYQALAKEKYGQTVAPHVEKVTTAAGPYYEIARTNALQTYYGHILPFYNAVSPYAVQVYGFANKFVVNTGIPYTRWAWTTTGVILDRKVWPKLRILYGENVEPQLVRIGERLGRYRDGKKLQAAVDSIDRSSSASSASETFSSISASVSSAHATVAFSSTVPVSSSTVISSTQVPQNTPLGEIERREKASQIVAKDLKTWQEKFAKAADEGSDEIEERITEITDRLVQNQAKKVGGALIIELEEAVKSHLQTLKKSIIDIVKSNAGAEESEELLSTAVRKAGVAIKDKAQAVRTWRQSYDAETNSLISKSVKDTFDIIDHIRDLGLQEIGMRWAWTDGITHKDWTKYHALRHKFDEWRLDVENVVTDHPGLAMARTASEETESKAMEIAENAAIELARLKETAKWKISTGDSSDDFSTKYIPPAAAIAGKKVAEKLSDGRTAIAGTTQGTLESMTSAASSSIAEAQSAVSDAASSLSASVVGTPQGSVESVVSVAKDSMSSLSLQASSSIIGKEPGMVEKASSSIGSAASQISNSATSLSDAAGSSISSLSSKATDGASKASSSIGSASSSIASSLSKSAVDATSSISSSASSASSSASKKVWGGAMAAQVEAREIVLDDIIDDSDDETYSEKIQSMASAAGDKFGEVTKAVSEALIRPTSTPGSLESATSLAAEQYSSALAAASNVLYGTEQGTGESVASVASSRYADAVAAASIAIYGTPKPISESAASSVRSAYNGLSSAASTAIYGAPTGAFESIQSVAASKLSEGLSAASSQYDSAKSFIGPASTPAAQKLLSQAQNQYYAGIGMAHARYSEFLNAASSAVLPTQTPFHESVYSRASASIVGTPTPTYQALLSQASEQYSSAVAAASSNLEDALASLSSVGAVASGNVVPSSSLADIASSRYSAASVEASKSYATASSAIAEKIRNYGSDASSAIIGSETPFTESVASAASENWEALVTKASHQIYGSPTPYFITRNFLSNVQEYAAQATHGAVSQYSAVQSLISELVSGKEPDFTASVYNRLSSAYYTGAGDAVSSASSYASEAFASASSVASSVFTPPPSLEAILDSASARVNEAVEAASVQFYGTQKGTYEQATSSAASAYSSMSSVASEKVYGTEAGYAQQAQLSISDAAASAQRAISEAIYGTSTGAYESATKVIAENFESATSQAAESYSAAQSKVSEVIFGKEQGAVESAQSRLNSAVESARARLAEFAANAGDGASEALSKASEGVEDMASSVSSLVGEATEAVVGKKDEL